MASNTSGEGEIRKRIVEADLVECMVALPGQLFYTTQIPVCLWFLARKKTRPLHTLFIDARKLGRLTDRVHRELTDEDNSRIVGTYHAWRGDPGAEQFYADIAGFCRSASIAEIGLQSFVLTPGRYVGAEDLEDDDEPLPEKLRRLAVVLEEQFSESARLEDAITRALRDVIDAT